MDDEAEYSHNLRIVIKNSYLGNEVDYNLRK